MKNKNIVQNFRDILKEMFVEKEKSIVLSKVSIEKLLVTFNFQVREFLI